MIRGARFREEQRARLAVLGAYATAALMRYPRKKRLPRLETLFKAKRRRVGRQTPEEQRAFFLDWARRAGLTVERHEKPVIEYPVRHG